LRKKKRRMERAGMEGWEREEVGEEKTGKSRCSLKEKAKAAELKMRRRRWWTSEDEEADGADSKDRKAYSSVVKSVPPFFPGGPPSRPLLDCKCIEKVKVCPPPSRLANMFLKLLLLLPAAAAAAAGVSFYDL
jgi:hypothetical protein